MSLTQALLLAFIAGFAYFSRRFMGDLYLERAIVLGPLTGLVLGDLPTGLAVGAALELIFIGAADVGGSVPPNLPIGAVLGTAFAINADLSPEQAMVIAVPAALLGAFGELIAKAVSTVFVTAAERYADRGSTRGIAAMVHLGNLVHFLCVAVPAFVGLRLGNEAVRHLSDAIDGPLQNGLMVAGAVLPALGFALLLSTLSTRPLMPFFFIGFLLAAYTGFGVLGVAALGFMIAAVWVFQKGGASLLHGGGGDADSADSISIPRRERVRIFWRSFAIQSAFSFDRMQAIGFTWTLIPWLRRLYPDREQRAQALRRHLTFFNGHAWLPGPILALVSDLEMQHSRIGAADTAGTAGAAGAHTADAAEGTGPAERRTPASGGPAEPDRPAAEDTAPAAPEPRPRPDTAVPADDADPEVDAAEEQRRDSVKTIQGVKGSLMGPLAGIGDSAFHGTLRPLLSGISASLALQGNMLAPLVFLIPVNLVHVAIRWISLSYGFRLGRRLFERLDQSAIKRLMEGASIAGLMGVGALVGTWLAIDTPLQYTQGEQVIKLQDMLDDVLPKMIPLVVTMAAYWAIRRRMNSMIVLLVLAVAGFGLGALGVLHAGG
ncbi:mannose/fructose/N-acetylgalactosamine-specific phosphotransferase system component IIC [Murinocardiopsis flavida]|uniref:Mannose/fructose/N-acetylgalactosamine-specific phosphotransferase system component IIC n=1 Tax=Murinocardiopsis flavida TaxID=645275 RepID=A0A2P8DTZ5_9ACTN|nr:PTS system mannose/fructose/sorbose family transporter subunit IID [Murinocardiopsis flavida]PSL00685.1 mannose/fructose/N-acetylgalactosamine-specific phosphotransferase system component IIC [Murinocardiopsis flavida]